MLKLDKIFSYGICIESRTLEGEKLILNTYKDYIDSIFLSTPRDIIDCDVSSRDLSTISSLDDTLNIIDYARSLGMKIDIPINAKHLTEDILNLIYNKFLKIVNPEEITTIDEYVDYFHSVLPNSFFVRSFNKGYYTDEVVNSGKWDSVIPRQELFWNKKLRTQKLENRFLINHACPNCAGCFSSHNLNDCRKWEYRDIKNIGGIENFLAYNLWFGDDLNNYMSRNSDEKYKFKLGLRSSVRFNTVNNYLDTLVNCKHPSVFLKDLETLHCCAEGHQIIELCVEFPELLWKFDWNKFDNKKEELWSVDL